MAHHTECVGSQMRTIRHWLATEGYAAMQRGLGDLSREEGLGDLSRGEELVVVVVVMGSVAWGGAGDGGGGLSSGEELGGISSCAGVIL